MAEHPKSGKELFRSSRPDYIETVLIPLSVIWAPLPLFRSSRPDYIETSIFPPYRRLALSIVPVFQTGLH